MARLILTFGIRVLAPFSFIAFILLITHFRSQALTGNTLTILSAGMVASTLGRGGFDQLMLRNSRSFRDADDVAARIFLTALVVGWIVAGALALPAAIVLNRIAGTDALSAPATLEIVLLSLALVTCLMISSAAQAAGRTFWSIASFPVVGYGVSAGALLLGVAPGRSLLIGFATAAIPALLMAGRHFRLHHARFELQWLVASRYFLLISTQALVFDWGMNLFAAWSFGPAQVATLAFCQRMAGILSLPLSAITPYLMAEFASHPPQRGNAALRTVVRNTLIFSAASQLPLIVALLGFNRQIAAAGGIEATTFLAVVAPLVLAHVVNVAGGPSGALLVMRGGPRDVALVVVTTGCLTVLGAAVASQAWGLIGISGAMAAGLIAQNLWYTLLVYRNEGFVPITLLRRQR